MRRWHFFKTSNVNELCQEWTDILYFKKSYVDFFWWDESDNLYVARLQMLEDNNG